MTTQGNVPDAPRPAPDLDLAARLFAELAARTGAARGVTRVSYGPGEAIAHDMLRREALALGLAVDVDAASNLYATLPGAGRGPPIIVGSHLDSVPMGGNFDGAAGVLLGLSVVSGLRKAGIAPPRDVTVMAIRAEESAWFGASYIGSRAAFGRLPPEELDGVRRSGDGIPLGAAISAAGGDPDALRRGRAHLDPARIGAFVEAHIEQGPVLVGRGLPIGIVTGIRGSFRYRHARCLGAYAHSGATPMASRRDAVQGAASLAVRANALPAAFEAEGADLVVTFGQFSTDPRQAAFSKVAGEVSFSLDVRSASPKTLEDAHARFLDLVAEVARTHDVVFDLGERSTSEPAAMDEAVVEALCAAAEAQGLPCLRMPSGAGHDAAVFARMGVPTGMIFLRNENGSHNPDEAMHMEDFGCAARILQDFCLAPPASA